MAKSLGTCKALKLTASRWLAASRKLETAYRKEASMLIGHRLYIVGRVDQQKQGIGVLDVNTWRWTRIKRDFHPLHRDGFTIVLVGDLMYLFGGFEEGRPLQVNYTRTYDPVMTQLSNCKSSGELNVLTGEIAREYIEDLRMIVAFGGLLDRERIVMSRVVGYSIDSNTWIVISTKGRTPSARTQHRSCLRGSKDIFFYGGRLRTSMIYSSVVCHLRCEAGNFTWHQVGWFPSPKYHYAASMNYIGGRIIILGGSDNHLVPNRTSYLYVYDFNESVGVEFNNGLTSFRSGRQELDLGLNGFPPHLANHSAAVLQDRLVVTGLYDMYTRTSFVITPL